jgi:serine/threonine protein kinase/sugar lactone lactonase YvrE
MIGQTILHYRILSQLGSGGMGVVYEAEDLKLGRRVALKFLPPDLAQDASALDRFMVEARAASALNHPGICTIYAVESADGQSFIAMELLEGESLDRRLQTGALPVDRLIEVSIQLADALDAAHAKGIIHRDIKPANIFLTARGQVKVLDFGLAKFSRAVSQMAMETVATQNVPAHLTSPGATVGTVAYMSPEQARAEELDSRSDLFSLGAVIYQMATGKLPFEGKTSAVVFNAILERDPVPAIQINPSLPPKLDEAIEKLLEKDRDLRYQSAADLRGDLKRLQRDLQPSRKISSPSLASSAGVSIPERSVSSANLLTAPAQSGAARSPSSSVMAAARQNRVGTGVTALVAVIVLLAAAYGVYSLLNRNRPEPFRSISMKKVTESGKAAQVAISPDGNYILHVVRDNGMESLWLRNLPTNSNTQVVAPEQVTYRALRFSPDGNYLYFERTEPGSEVLRYLYRAPILGGSPEKLVTDIDSNITFSPQGKRFAYVRANNPEPGKTRLIVRKVDGGDEKVLAVNPLDHGLVEPAWSPDGKVIVCVSIAIENALGSLVAVDAVTGKQSTSFFKSAKTALLQPTWLPDGSGLILLSNFSGSQIIYVSYPEGKSYPITQDTNNYNSLSLAADGRTLASVLKEDHLSLWLAPAADGGGSQFRQVPSGERFYHFSWTRDGRILFSNLEGMQLMAAESGAETPLKPDQGGFISDSPYACADGKYIVFTSAFSNGTKDVNIWRMDAGGGNLKQLSTGRLDQSPVCSPDGRWTVYRDQLHDGALMRVSIDGGTAQEMSPELSGPADFSPDGKLLALSQFDHMGNHRVKLVLIAVDSGQTVQKLEFEKIPEGPVRFTRDGKAVLYPITAAGVDNLWQQNLDGTSGKQITSFDSEHIQDFHYSVDGGKLAVLRGQSESDVALIQDTGSK